MIYTENAGKAHESKARPHLCVLAIAPKGATLCYRTPGGVPVGPDPRHLLITSRPLVILTFISITPILFRGILIP